MKYGYKMAGFGEVEERAERIEFSLQLPIAVRVLSAESIRSGCSFSSFLNLFLIWSRERPGKSIAINVKSVP